MSENKFETLSEVSSQAAVSSTMKRTELEETSNFKIGNMISDPKDKSFRSSDGSEIRVQFSCSQISTTQIIPNNNSPKQSSNAAATAEHDNKHNISNADTTTVPGKSHFHI